MSRHRPDRRLRRAIAGLARLHADDVESILGALEPRERARVDALLDAAAGRGAESDEHGRDYKSVSPWLLARMDPAGRGRARERDQAAMTEAAREALKAAAEPFRAQSGLAGRRGRTLAGQTWRIFAGTRA